MNIVKKSGKLTVTKNIFIRPGPAQTAPDGGYLKPRQVVDVKGYVTDGQNIYGNSTWFFDDNANYYWSGGFISPELPLESLLETLIDPAAVLSPVGSVTHLPADELYLFTPDLVKQMIPDAPLPNIEKHLPHIVDALRVQSLIDKLMALMALATVAVETGSFQPLDELPSRFNTSPGAHPFNKYDNKTDLGNKGYPDGANFKGRGFVQLTGRANYTRYSAQLGLDDLLIREPELANEPVTAAQLLALFLKDNEARIRKALESNDLSEARKAINGGSHGLDVFTRVYHKGLLLLS